MEIRAEIEMVKAKSKARRERMLLAEEERCDEDAEDRRFAQIQHKLEQGLEGTSEMARYSLLAEYPNSRSYRNYDR